MIPNERFREERNAHPFEGVPQPQNMSEVCSRLKRLNIGRAIIRNGSEGEILGTVLPLNLDQTRHVVMLKEGDVMIIEHADNKPETVKKYQTWFTPNPLAIVWMQPDNPQGLEFFSYQLQEPSQFGARVILRNDLQTSIEPINAAINAAVYFGVEFRDQQAFTRAVTRENILEIFNSTDLQPPTDEQLKLIESIKADETPPEDSEKVQKETTEAPSDKPLN